MRLPLRVVWSVCLLVVLAATLLAVLILRLAQGPRFRAVAADGTIVTLEAVTYGKVHLHATGPFWKRLL